MVAFTTLCGLCEPSDFVRTLGIPAAWHHGAYRTTGDHTGTGGSRLQQHRARTELAEHRVENRGFKDIDLAEILLRRFDPFLMAAGTSFALPVPKPTTFATDRR